MQLLSALIETRSSGEEMLAAKKGKGSFVDAVTANIYKVVNLINSVAFLALTICSLTNLHDVMQVSINEQYFKNHVPIAVGSFDGTVDSFGCAIGNIRKRNSAINAAEQSGAINGRCHHDLLVRAGIVDRSGSNAAIGKGI